MLFPIQANMTIKRNVAWIAIGVEFEKQNQSLVIVYKYLKQHQFQYQLQVVDYQAVLAIDKMIKSNKEVNKNLKKIRRSMTDHN